MEAKVDMLLETFKAIPAMAADVRAIKKIVAQVQNSVVQL